MSETPKDESDDPRARGTAKMQEVYGFSVDPDPSTGDFVRYTVDHLFGDIWSRGVLDRRDRRLVTIGVLAALGQAPLLEIQFESALEREELTTEQIRELAIHLAHYVGWPLGTNVYAAAEKVIAKRTSEENASGRPEGTNAAD